MKKLTVLFFLITFSSVFSQKKLDENNSKENIKSGTITAIISIFPYHVANKTFKNNSNQTYKVFYGSVWIGVGVLLDLLSVGEFLEAYKIKKNSKNEN